MNATAPCFTFAEKYLLRAAVEEDLDLATLWTEADPNHAELLKPEFWLEQGNHRYGYLLHDDEGPLFFFKMHFSIDQGKSRIRVFIQFPLLPGNKERLQEGLIRGMQWLEEKAQEAEVGEIFFDSRNESLIRFSVKRLGFTRDGQLLHKPVKRREEEG